MVLVVKSPPAHKETWVRSLGQEVPLEECTAAHSSILAWRMPWTEEPGGLQSIELQSRKRVKCLSAHTHKCAPDCPVLLTSGGTVCQEVDTSLHTGRTKQSVRWSRATLVNRDCVFAGEGLCKSGLGARTENSQEPGLIRERDDGPGCSIPGLRRMCIFFRIRLTPQTAVSECPGQGPQDHSQGSGVQGSDLPENEKEAAFREVWGAGTSQGPGQLTSAM